MFACFTWPKMACFPADRFEASCFKSDGKKTRDLTPNWPAKFANEKCQHSKGDTLTCGTFTEIKTKIFSAAKNQD